MPRRAIEIHGTVQGVGFRPFVYKLACDMGLGGFVRNSGGTVAIEVEGGQESLDHFLERVVREAPPLARIERLDWSPRDAVGEEGFRIDGSDGGIGHSIVIAPDVATCQECLAEVFDPGSRRYQYPFTNCTNCGPRLTIVLGAPYDRSRTTMAGFEMCAECRAEYENPADRRFHAQPIACPKCGPRLAVLDSKGISIETSDPMGWLAAALNAGKIAAIKGLGGYHLACDARNANAVGELRRRKQREEKPFAVMAGDLAVAERLCEVSEAERELLVSARRPIVLLKRRPGIEVAEGVAPRNPTLGLMLPYTPLHHLLMKQLEGVPLVMTSGNRSDEPIAYEEADALERLGGIADLFVVHDRPIHVRCDDSVTRIVGGSESPIRRSRGYAPQPVGLPFVCSRPILAVGGQLKGTFALGSQQRAVLSHHLGDLDHLEAFNAFRRDIGLYENLFQVHPEVVAHDLHPDYASTRYALSRTGTTLVGVQHHHAHLASCMAEHGLKGNVIGVTFDGSGFGTDGAIWGGEFLVGGYEQFRRMAHLRYVPMPGGERAVREPWRMAMAHLMDAQTDCQPLANRVAGSSRRTIARMMERRLNSPMTSSAGRLFDAAACLAGVRDTVSHEGQAAMELEWLAAGTEDKGEYPFEVDETGTIDTRPLIAALAKDANSGLPAAVIARRFHTTMSQMVFRVNCLLRKATGHDRVVLSGGVFMNELLVVETARRLSDAGFVVYCHRAVPPNDGGLSLGQLAVAAARM
ncbi:MAG TPA: carbamoyltransferase HypF [Tepidisphaeraceae bacterium]|nr:carbamoyltransferase HypF [Tepidisphaeraceae bacterium]